jgi:hypothetical protein
MTFDFALYPKQALKEHAKREEWVMKFRMVTGWDEEKVRECMAKADAAASQTSFRAELIYLEAFRAICMGKEPKWE